MMVVYDRDKYTKSKITLKGGNRIRKTVFAHFASLSPDKLILKCIIFKTTGVCGKQVHIIVHLINKLFVTNSTAVQYEMDHI